MHFGLRLLLFENQAAIQDHVHQEQPNGETAQNMKQYRKTVSTAMCILLALVVCYLPYSIVGHLQQLLFL